MLSMSTSLLTKSLCVVALCGGSGNCTGSLVVRVTHGRDSRMRSFVQKQVTEWVTISATAESADKTSISAVPNIGNKVGISSPPLLIPNEW